MTELKPIGMRERMLAAETRDQLYMLKAEFDTYSFASAKTTSAVLRAYKRRLVELSKQEAKP